MTEYYKNSFIGTFQATAWLIKDAFYWNIWRDIKDLKEKGLKYVVEGYRINNWLCKNANSSEMFAILSSEENNARILEFIKHGTRFEFYEDGFKDKIKIHNLPPEVN